MTAEIYVDILSHYFLQTARELYDRNWYLHQDNDPKHTSGLSRSFLEYSNFIWVDKTIIIY